MNVKEMENLFEYREPSYLEFKRRRRCDFPKIQVPNIRRDVEEVRRLMKRLPTADLDESVSCCICRSEDHLHFYCPCLDKVGDNVVLGPYHDFICLGCGKIGEICCSKGAFADSKLCVGCMAYGHWYWERKCMRGDVGRWAVPLPSIDGVQPPPTPHDNYESEGELVYDGGCFDSNEVTFPTDKDNLQSKDEDTLIETSEGSSGRKTYLKSESESSQRMRGKREKRERVRSFGQNVSERTLLVPPRSLGFNLLVRCLGSNYRDKLASSTQAIIVQNSSVCDFSMFAEILLKLLLCPEVLYL